MLDRLMRNEKPSGEPRIALPPIGVLARELTDFYAADDPLVAEVQAAKASRGHPWNGYPVARAQAKVIAWRSASWSKALAIR